MCFRAFVVLAFVGVSLNAQPLSSAGGSPEHHTDVEITWRILKAHELPALGISQLRVPAEFRVQKFAENVGNARILAIGPAGDTSRSGLHGITFFKGKVYLAAVHKILRADVHPDGTFGPLEMIIHDLPDAGQHNTCTVQIGPDEMMYISIGSTCNECAEPNQENATILRASLDGKTWRICA